MKRVVATLLFILITAHTTAVAKTFFIAPRDGHSLAKALCHSEEFAHDGPAIINLAANSRYVLDMAPDWSRRSLASKQATRRNVKIGIPRTCTFRTAWVVQIDRDLTVNGNGSEINFGGKFGFFIPENVRLTLRDLELTGGNRYGAVYNLGDVRMQRVTIRENAVIHSAVNPDKHGFDRPTIGAGVNNFGDMEIRNGFFYANTLSVPGWDGGDCIFGAGGAYNAGQMRLNNDSFYSNSTLRCGAQQIMNDFSLANATILVSNSLFGNRNANCRGRITSLGFNLEQGSSSCKFGAEGDLREDQFQIRAEADDGGILAADPVSNIFVDSTPPRDSGSPARSGDTACERLDQRGFVRPTSDRCDIGAFEVSARGAPGEIVGLWFDPNNDGHYLNVTQLPGQGVLMVWNTFDPSGRQLWVYGIGAREGNSVRAMAYKNTGGILIPGQSPTAATASDWGQLSLLSVSCDRIEFSYQANDAHIGSGTLSLTRLASEDRLQCHSFHKGLK